ncbi:MAG: TolC family protein [Bacteroidetes bacterium]|nr:TolC family protein [Bacteroidota bacterium]MBS1932194.1 TolC family protein [Bacteroidota bacterium]
MFHIKYLLAFLFLFGPVFCIGQDTLRVSMDTADKIFLQKNLMMVAAQMNVDAQKAQEIQARLYPNPQFTVGVNTYDSQNKKLFYAGSNGEKSFEFDQLILLGSKRKNLTGLAKQNTQQAQLGMEDLMRNLKYQLHNDLLSLYFDLLTVHQYNQHLQKLDSIITGYQEQANKGNIALKDVVRLKTAYMSLNNDRTELLNNIEEEQKELRLLLQTNQFVLFQFDDAAGSKYEQLPILDSLQNLALRHRSDLKEAVLNKSIADLNIRYQKSLAVPDLSLGASYDQRGGAFNNQYLLTFGIPLPFWNRNQGNIKSAQIQSKIADVGRQQQQLTVSGEVTAAWSNMQRSISDYLKTIKMYSADFNTVFEGMTANFLKRNISILEFVDFFESYNSGIAEVNRVKKQLALSGESVNYVVEFPVY